MKRMVNSRTYAKVRGAIGVAFIALGALIVVQIVHGVGLRLEALPGALLGAAMIALGYVRVRGAIAAWKPPQ